MHKNTKTMRPTTIVITCISMLVYCFYLGAISSDKAQCSEAMAYVIVPMVIVAIVIISAAVEYTYSHRFFTLYNIFNAFFVVFNIGQCLLWIFGIHTSKDLSESIIYGRYYVDQQSIYRAELLFIASYPLMITGQIIGYTSNHRNSISKRTTINREALLIASSWLAIPVIAITLVSCIMNYSTAQQYGYTSLYYGDKAGVGIFQGIATSLFLLVLLGLLIGSSYRKNVTVFVYSIFSVYAIVSLLTGDRGEWITKLIILLWADNQFNRRRTWREWITIIFVAYVAMFIANAIVSLRETGLSIDAFNSKLSTQESPVVDLLTEFGSSMGINIVAMNHEIPFPYGNTILMSFITAPSTSIAALLGMKYEQLNSWFSQTYLGLSYGADFTLLGELVLNFGGALAPLGSVVLGWIVGKMDAICSMDVQENPVAVSLLLAWMAIFIKAVRSTVWFALNGIFYTLLFLVAVIVVEAALRVKTSGRDGGAGASRNGGSRGGRRPGRSTRRRHA